MIRAKLAASLVAGLLCVATTVGCQGGEDTGGQSGQKVTLNFWAWAPNIDKVVAKWNDANPDIQVKVSTQAQGDELVTKLLAANKAGKPPDLFQAEYQALPSLVTAGVAADVTEHTKPIKGDFADSAWRLVSFGNATYAIPQDFAPMMLLYREDLFKQYGLTVPKTWAQYADEARKLRKKAPKKYLTTFSADDPGWFAGLSQQAGAQWWSVQGKSWDVGIQDAATQQVAEYWEDLVTSGAVDKQSMYTPQWNKQLNDGTLLSWPSAVWGPAVLEGIAPKTKGKWAMAPLPAWSEGDQRTGFWGGSSTAIAAKSKNQAAAAKFATWLNTDAEAVEDLVTLGSLYPASTKGQETPALEEPPPFMPNQPGFYAEAKRISADAPEITWGPNVNVTYGAYKDAFGKAIQKRAPFADALATMQTTTVADMKKSGFTVSTG